MAPPQPPTTPHADVTGADIEAADGAMYELPLGTDVPAEYLRDAIAQLLADYATRSYAAGWNDGHRKALSDVEWADIEWRQRLAKLRAERYEDEDPTAAPQAGAR